MANLPCTIKYGWQVQSCRKHIGKKCWGVQQNRVDGKSDIRRVSSRIFQPGGGGGSSISATVQPPTLHEVGGGIMQV